MASFLVKDKNIFTSSLTVIKLPVLFYFLIMDGQITKILQIKTESEECETSSYKVPFNSINSKIERCLTKQNTTLPPQTQECGV